MISSETREDYTDEALLYHLFACYCCAEGSLLTLHMEITSRHRSNTFREQALGGEKYISSRDSSFDLRVDKQSLEDNCGYQVGKDTIKTCRVLVYLSCPD